jgi:hypothetical protein
VGGQQFAKPDDIGTHQAAAAWAGRRRILRNCRQLDRLVICKATVPVQITMQFYHVLTSCAAMKSVNILGDQRKIGYPTFQFGERDVPWIGFSCRHKAAPVGIPLPHQCRIGAKCSRRRQFTRIVARP